MKKFKLATRGSRLALAQAHLIQEILSKAGMPSEVVIVSTKGDKNKVSPLAKIGGDGLFVREIEKAVISEEADIAVHCGKDLPFETDERLIVAGVTKSADCRDCMVSIKGRMPDKKPVIGTGSPRRMTELTGLHKDAVFKDIRGNITTRIEKLKNGDYDAVILAKAGLDRIGFEGEGYEIRVFETSEMIPAPCQGILALQCRKDDENTRSLIERITDEATFRRFEVERHLFCLLHADCTSAVGVNAGISGEDMGELEIKAMYEGRRASAAGRYEQFRELCEELYHKLT
ncbi:MAG: hydroxymethylbilane synthase [Lachnospiraceae bacterium]|nr:hydroxymethylbilane synthase [Lachnospiraceae bacterium]